VVNANRGEGVAAVLQMKVKLGNPVLGATCYVGSNSEPLTPHLTTGTTSPPSGTTPISGSPGEVVIHAHGQLFSIVNSSLVDNAFPAPGVETPILPEEAAAAAAAAARVPRLIVADDPAARDELAVEVALSALRPVTNEPVQAGGDANVEDVHPLVDPLPDDAEPNE
ncbi:MAG: hypothetical protein ACXWLR_10540, partial [Myxococcales bacterium]